jgi:hypothetical protein
MFLLNPIVEELAKKAESDIIRDHDLEHALIACHMLI